LIPITVKKTRTFTRTVRKTILIKKRLVGPSIIGYESDQSLRDEDAADTVSEVRSFTPEPVDDFITADTDSGGIFARRLCPECPRGVKITGGRSREGENQVLCCRRRKTVFKTVRRTKRVTRTVTRKAVSCFAFGPYLLGSSRIAVKNSPQAVAEFHLL